MRRWGFVKTVGLHSDHARAAYEPSEESCFGPNETITAERVRRLKLGLGAPNVAKRSRLAVIRSSERVSRSGTISRTVWNNSVVQNVAELRHNALVEP